MGYLGLRFRSRLTFDRALGPLIDLPMQRPCVDSSNSASFGISESSLALTPKPCRYLLSVDGVRFNTLAAHAPEPLYFLKTRKIIRLSAICDMLFVVGPILAYLKSSVSEKAKRRKGEKTNFR